MSEIGYHVIHSFQHSLSLAIVFIK